eukprot:8020606-Pyramimonas_sp.AAC.1
MDVNTMAKIMPILMRAVLGNSRQIRMLMAAEFVTMTMPEELDIVQAAFNAGKAYADQAAELREDHRQDPSKALPEVTMGPACVQIFLVVARKISSAAESVGARNFEAWQLHLEKLDAIQDIDDLIVL